MTVLDEHDDVVHALSQRRRDQIQRVADQFLEALRTHPDRH